MKDFALIVPSRGRPDYARSALESILKTTSSDVIYVLDADDPTLLQYQLPEDEPRLIVNTIHPIGRGRAVNKAIEANPDYRMYMATSDDVTYVRDGWDREVIEAMDQWPDGIGVVHMESNNQDTYVNFACISRKMIEVLGWYNYPVCNFYCQDTILQILCEALGRIHYIQPKVAHHEYRLHEQWHPRLMEDSHKFLMYCACQFHKDLAKLKGAMK